jgi:hypothetical protein
MLALAGGHNPLLLEEIPGEYLRAGRIAASVVAKAACQSVSERRQIMTLVSPTMNVGRHSEVVHAARAMLVTDIDFDLFLGKRQPVILDVDSSGPHC